MVMSSGKDMKLTSSREHETGLASSVKVTSNVVLMVDCFNGMRELRLKQYNSSLSVEPIKLVSEVLKVVRLDTVSNSVMYAGIPWSISLRSEHRSGHSGIDC